MEAGDNPEFLGNFENPVFRQLNDSDQQPTEQTPRPYYTPTTEVYGHGAAERTLRDPDTGQLFLDM